MQSTRTTIITIVDNVLSIATSQHLNEQFVTFKEQPEYNAKNEAPDKFIGMQLEWNASGKILLHQERHEDKLLTKYNITKTAPTPLPSNSSRTNYLTSKRSKSIDVTSYQRLVGDIIYQSLTNTAIPYANSAVTQQTHYCPNATTMLLFIFCVTSMVTGNKVLFFAGHQSGSDRCGSPMSSTCLYLYILAAMGRTMP